MSAVSSVSSSSSQEALGPRVARLAGVLSSEHFPTADRAALKRHAAGQAPPVAFYRLWLRHLHDDLPGEEDTQSWALLAWGLALMGAKAHRPDRPLGKVLAKAGYTEARLERLLSADADIRLDLLASLVRFIAAKGEGFDWLDAARFLLTRDPERREAINRHLAADYYRNLPKSQET